MAKPSVEGLINPVALKWARTESCLKTSDASSHLKIPEARIIAWEAGGSVPTLKQLRKLADLYKRSVGVFFLREIPVPPGRPVDYRRLDPSSTGLMSPSLANGIREAQAKRGAALELYGQLEIDPPVWTIKLSRSATYHQVAAQLLTLLGVTMKTRQSWKDEYHVLNGWRTAIESLGIIITQISHVPLSEMRGCSLALSPLPIIILNSKDRPLGRVFTLLHELTHLARAESGLCDTRPVAEGTRPVDLIEVYCNHTAGEMLVPMTELMKLESVRSANAAFEWTSDQLGELRRFFWASKEVILRRLLENRKTSLEYYQEMRESFNLEYAKLGQQTRSTPIPQYRKVILSNGRLVTRLALDAYQTHVITGSELSRILNTKLDHLSKIESALAASTSS